MCAWKNAHDKKRGATIVEKQLHRTTRSQYDLRDMCELEPQNEAVTYAEFTRMSR